jgi:tetratricopeptide (TPR) repeat protein
MEQTDEDNEQILSRNRGDARFRRAVSRNPGAKLLVDEAIRVFVATLPSACKAGHVAVAKLVTETRERLETIHTWRADERPHFIKSISNVADQLLRRQESASAIELLSWSVRKGLADAVTYSSLVDTWGKAGDAVRAQEVFDAALAAGIADAVTYNSLVDAWGKAGELFQAQRVFEKALTAGHADEITDLVLLRALLSNSASGEVLTRAVEFLLSRRQFTRMSPSVAKMVGWAAARLGRLDWIQSLPAGARNARTLYSFALRVAPSNDALVFLQSLGATATAGIITLQYRLLGATAPAAELRSLASECRNLVERILELDSFSRVRIAETEARCLRTCGAIEDVIASWAPIDDRSIGNRETRASLLAESGRDVLIGGLRHREERDCKRGAQRLMQGWSLARLSDFNDLETLWAASEALSGYADARTEIATAPPELVSVVWPILAEGARDGRWAMEAVRTGDLLDFYLTPALAGMEFLAELKQSLPLPSRTVHAT